MYRYLLILLIFAFLPLIINGFKLDFCESKTCTITLNCPYNYVCINGQCENLFEESLETYYEYSETCVFDHSSKTYHCERIHNFFDL